MDKTYKNALKRARESKGVTQERAAEMSGYSVDAIRAWELGSRRASVEVLDMLALCYDAPWLSYVYLREQSRENLGNVVPEFRPGEPVSRAALSLLDKIMRFGEQHSDRRLVALAADGQIDATERAEYDAIMEDLAEICKAALELKFAETGGDA